MTRITFIFSWISHSPSSARVGSCKVRASVRSRNDRPSGAESPLQRLPSRKQSVRWSQCCQLASSARFSVPWVVKPVTTTRHATTHRATKSQLFCPHRTLSISLLDAVNLRTRPREHRKLFIAPTAFSHDLRTTLGTTLLVRLVRSQVVPHLERCGCPNLCKPCTKNSGNNA